MTQNPKPYRIVSPQGIAWATRYISTEGAWGRILYLHRLKDTPTNRAKMENLGWRVRMTQPASASSD